MALMLLKTFRSKVAESGKRKLFIIPYLFTFSNAIFGFFSIIKALEGNFVWASWFILFAAVMDMFDGRLARAIGSCSYLGMELDSLCDAISFCLAPVILLYVWKFYAFGIVGLIILSFYLCCGLLRLAKYNSITAKQDNDIGFFVGMPTPLAALMVAQMVIYYPWIIARVLPFMQYPLGLMSVIFILSILMISPIYFLSFKKISSKRSIVGGFLASTLLIFGFFKGIPFLFLGIFSYIISCILYYVYSNIYYRHKGLS